MMNIKKLSMGERTLTDDGVLVILKSATDLEISE